jgi:acyl carrier protein
MTRTEILAELKTSLEEMFDIEHGRITPEARLRDDLDLDSIDAIDLAVRLQKLLKKRIEIEVLKSLETVDDVISLIEKELAGEEVEG